MPGSIASLSRLSSLTGNPNRNQFFDPTGADADRSDALGLMEDEMETRTGLNWTARHELAMRGLQDMMDEYDFKRDQRRDAQRRMDAAFLGPEGWARSTPEDAANARSLALGDARVAHDAANLPTMLRMQHDKTVGDAQAKSDAYWLPGTQSMLDNESRRTEDLNRSRWLDPVLARNEGASSVANINAGARTGAAQITANGRSSDVMNEGLMDQLTALIRRGDVNPSDPESMLKALQGFMSLRNGAVAGSGGVPGASASGGGAQNPDLSGLAPGHGRTFSSGPFAGQTWTVDAQGKPQRVK